MLSDGGPDQQIRVTINKKETLLRQGATISEVLEQRSGGTRFAVWLNGKQLRLAEYPAVEIQEGDNIKILRIVAGG